MATSVEHPEAAQPALEPEAPRFDRQGTDGTAPGGAHPRRPGPIRWLGYAFGATLPREFDEWVYRDTTSRTWVLRHLGRALVQLAPILLVVLVFVPGPFWIRGVGAIAATAMGLLFCFAYMVETTDRRLTKAGFPSGSAEIVRRERSLQARHRGTEVRRAKLAGRRQRREQRHQPQEDRDS